MKAYLDVPELIARNWRTATFEMLQQASSDKYVWKGDYRLDVCHVTYGTQTKHWLNTASSSHKKALYICSHNNFLQYGILSVDPVCLLFSY